MDHFDAIFQSIVDGDEKRTVRLCRDMLDGGCRPIEILERGLIPAMDRLGVLLNKGERFIPQVLISARAMQSAVALIQPQLLGSGGEARRETVVVGTVKGDIHTIGKNLVGIMLQSAGFHVVDLGSNVDTADFIQAVRMSRARVVAMSAMLTTSMTSMKNAVKQIQKEDFGYPLHIIVGGAPITPSFAREIHAEYSATMLDTMNLALEISSTPWGQ